MKEPIAEFSGDRVILCRDVVKHYEKFLNPLVREAQKMLNDDSAASFSKYRGLIDEAMKIYANYRTGAQTLTHQAVYDKFMAITNAMNKREFSQKIIIGSKKVVDDSIVAVIEKSKLAESA